jgi:fatty acid desaturase
VPVAGHACVSARDRHLEMKTAPILENSLEEPDATPHSVHSGAFETIVLSLFLAQGMIWWAVFRGWTWLAVPLVLIAAHLMHGLLIGFHEASHGLLRRRRWLNEFDGILIGIFSLLPFTLYRVVHQTHHMHLSTERDEEFWPLVSPQEPRWLRRVAAFLELNLGLVYAPLIFLRAFLRRGSRIRSPKVRARIWRELLLTALVWISVLSLIGWFGVWKYFLWMYLAPAVVAANLQSWRKYIEHVGLMSDTVNGATRSIVAESWGGRLLALTLLHEPFHGIHHQRAGLPHTVLPQYTADLLPKHPHERVPYLSYRQALPELLRSLENPRVGAQWRLRA